MNLSFYLGEIQPKEGRERKKNEIQILTYNKTLLIEYSINYKGMTIR